MKRASGVKESLKPNWKVTVILYSIIYLFQILCLLSFYNMYLINATNLRDKKRKKDQSYFFHSRAHLSCLHSRLCHRSASFQRYISHSCRWTLRIYIHLKYKGCTRNWSELFPVTTSINVSYSYHSSSHPCHLHSHLCHHKPRTSAYKIHCCRRCFPICILKEKTF